MIRIDFHGSTHGHFLEFVINKFIMQIDISDYNIFNENGAAHVRSEEYLKKRLVECGHYSNANINLSTEEPLIRIDIDSNCDRDFYIAFVNLLYRAGDVGLTRQIDDSISEEIKKNPVALRNNFFAKFNERDLYAKHYKSFKPSSSTIFVFPFLAFYSWTEFNKKLSDLSKFLNQLYFPDSNLFKLWTRFIELNQGINSFNKIEKILEKIFSNEDFDFECLFFEEAFLNYNLSKICRIFDGVLFEQKYPTNTKQIYKILQDHLAKIKYL